MKKIIVGRVWKFGNNIDTDIITPADTTSFGMADEQEWKMVVENSFRAVRREFFKSVAPGDILVAGRNFGLGSHREQANIVLRHLGFAAVVAESVARIYFRNSIATGMPIFAVPGIAGLVEEGDELEIDMEFWKVRERTSGRELSMQPYSPIVQSILEGGGILEVLRQRILAEGQARSGA
jgi:3-isopropylmalate/(R)-2-methylmalate dehydratase small subunit